MEYTFILPCYMQLDNKKISLTLNWYRNAHHYILNNVKQSWRPVSFPSQFNASQITIDYTLILCDNRRTDAMNWISVADKFFSDWLTGNGYIIDDCASVYTGGSFKVLRDTSLSAYQIVAKVTKTA